MKAKEIKFIKTKKGQNKNEFYFCFTQNSNLSSEINNFYEGSSIVTTTKFMNAIRDLKALIYNLKNSLHSFRHTAADTLRKNKVDIAVIQAFMGHSDIKTTLEYFHVSKEDLKEAEL